MRTACLLLALALLALACGPQQPGEPAEPEPPPPEIEPVPDDEADTTGLVIRQTVSPVDTVQLSFEHPLAAQAEISFGAPLAVVDVETGKEGTTPYALDFSIQGEGIDKFYEEVGSKISGGATATSVSLGVLSEATYGSALESIEEGSTGMAGQCEMSFGFSEDEVLSSGGLPCEIRVTEVPPGPLGGVGIALPHPYLFDCHSHWGIGTTTCHTKTATACTPPTVCSCGRRGQTRCSNSVLCSCV